MDPAPRLLRLAPVALLLALVRCGSLDATGRPCEGHPDCPMGMVCAAGSDDGARVCRPGFSPAAAGDGGVGSTADGGGLTDAGLPGTGGAPTWCKEIGPLLQQSCGGCHGQSASGGAPSTFRLDTYGPQDGVPGAYSKALRIQARAVDQGTMPPSGALDAERRAILGAWVAAGAPECGDVAPGDGGTLPPQEIPETVSYVQHVQPIFDTFCVSCHGRDPEGDLELRAGVSHRQLLDRSDCDSDYQRVVPGAPERSMLWMAISDHPDSCAPAMPDDTPGLKTVSETDFLIIERWILQGAVAE